MDTSSEAWRHACEVQTVLAMPVERRRGFLDLVGQRRGLAAKQQLAGDVYRAWIAKQADSLLAMERDDQRMARLLKIQISGNIRTRGDVEAEMERRLAANDNETERAAAS